MMGSKKGLLLVFCLRAAAIKRLADTVTSEMVKSTPRGRRSRERKIKKKIARFSHLGATAVSPGGPALGIHHDPAPPKGAVHAAIEIAQ